MDKRPGRAPAAARRDRRRTRRLTPRLDRRRARRAARGMSCRWDSTSACRPARSPRLAAKSSAQNAHMVSCLAGKARASFYLEAPFIVQLLPAMLGGAPGGRLQRHPPVRSVGTSACVRQDPAAWQRRGPYPVARSSAPAASSCLSDVDGIFTAGSESASRRRAHSRDPRRGAAAHEPPTLPIRARGAAPPHAGAAGESVRLVNGPVPGQSHARPGWRAGGECDSCLTGRMLGRG